MKRAVALILSILLVMMLAACGGNETKENNNATNQAVSQGDNSTASSETVDASDKAQSSQGSSDSSNEEWRQFLKDYEAWVDDYIELVNKYKENPTDMSILSDYTEMMSELVEWSERTEEIQGDLSPEDLTEYLDTLTRILEKLNKVAY